VLCLVRLGKTHRFGFLLAGFGLSLVLQRFRFYSIAVLLLAGLTGVAVAVTRRLFRLRHARIAVAVLVLCVAIGGASLAAAHYGETVTALSVYARGVETVDAAGQTLLWFTPELGFVRDFLKAAFVYQLGPFPWIFSGVDIGGTMFYPGMYLIYALFPFFLLGFTDLARELDGCRAFALSAWLLHALVEIFLNQSGGRQRIMVDALFICCAAAGWSRRQGRSSFVAVNYALLLAFAAVHIAART